MTFEYHDARLKLSLEKLLVEIKDAKNDGFAVSLRCQVGDITQSDVCRFVLSKYTTLIKKGGWDEE